MTLPGASSTLGVIITIMTEIAISLLDAADGQLQNCGCPNVYFTSWTSRAIKRLDYLHNDKNFLAELLDSAPCPPPWNTSLLCEEYPISFSGNSRGGSISRLSCSERTQLLNKCLDAHVVKQDLLSILKKCSNSLDCEYYTRFCRSKLSYDESKIACAVPDRRTSHQIFPISDSKTTVVSYTAKASTGAYLDHIDVSKDSTELPISGVTMEVNSSSIQYSVTMDYNTTANGTIVVVKNSAPGDSRNDPSHIHSTDLSVLWCLLILPYCFIVVPCFIHFCIKRRRKKSIYKPAEMEQQTKQAKANGTVVEEPLIQSANISLVSSPIPNSENRKSIGDAFDDFEFIDADSEQLIENEEVV